MKKRMINMNNNSVVSEKFVLSSLVSIFLLMPTVSQASDLQIYAKSAGGRKTVVMMMDTSASMAKFFDHKATGNSLSSKAYSGSDYSTPITTNQFCDGVNEGSEGAASTDTTYTDNYSDGFGTTYSRKWCTTGKNGAGYRYYDRLTRLKIGMLALLNSDNTQLNDVYMGLGQYPIPDGVSIDGVKAKMLVPAMRLGERGSEHRIRLKTAIANLQAWGKTPMAHAYAEAAAYLMGTNTSGTDSGFGLSDSTTKSGANYLSPLPAQAGSCHAQGIYLMTDGEPDSSSNAQAQTLMQQALNGNNFSCPTGTTLSGNSSQAWECIGNFSRSLFNASSNPKRRSFVTALAGFNGGYLTLSNGDAQNGCKLGSRTAASLDGTPPDDFCSPNGSSTYSAYRVQPPGYGNGSFFPVIDAADITSSVQKFIGRLNNNVVGTLTTGAVSVPVDSLDPSSFQAYGYLRMLEPNPANPTLIWRGNLKKYDIFAGALRNGATSSSSTVVDQSGFLDKNLVGDLWDSIAPSWLIDQGGAYAKIPMPLDTLTDSAKLRPLFTDVSAATSTTLTPITTTAPSSASSTPVTAATRGTPLLRVPVLPAATTATDGSYILTQFKDATGSILKDFPLATKLRLLNYLGYNVPLTSTALPATLTAPTATDGRFLSLGGLIHAHPLQLTYDGALNSDGTLTDTRTQSLLYGSMEGGLHLVNAATGVEQMVFVPVEVLKNNNSAAALRKGETGDPAPTYGVDHTWVSDSAYKVVTITGTSGAANTSKVSARYMNVYGGLRMGGESYYGLNLFEPTTPKILFRIGRDQTNFTRMGQSWSKPVLANIRYNGAIKRVMIVGGGYDMCYENPRFTLQTSGDNLSCTSKTVAQGNAVYIVDAETGERLWWTSNTGASTNNSNMKHSIVSRISALDRDADGLVDHLYFGDLGGQVFRADLNNNPTATTTSGTTTYSDFGVRVVRLLDLSTPANGGYITAGDNPRFYEPPTVTIHDEGSNTFILVGIASGDRSSPLDVAPTSDEDRAGVTPQSVLSGRPVNKIYGLIDRDFIKTNLMVTGTGAPTLQSEMVLADLRENPQTATGKVANLFFPTTTGETAKKGWYRSLSSDTVSNGGVPTVVEKANGTFRKSGGMKAFEEPFAITGNLAVPVYDPETQVTDTDGGCSPRVIGSTMRQVYCLPYGACLNSSGEVNVSREINSGFSLKEDGSVDNLLGPGILGIAPGPDSSVSTSSTSSCGGLTLLGNTGGAGKWSCTRKLVPTRWYEKYVRVN